MLKKSIELGGSKKIFYYFLVTPANYFFPVPATKVMAAIIDFHHDLMFYLMFFTVFIFWMLLTTVLLFSTLNKQKIFVCSGKVTVYNKFLEFFWTIIPVIFLCLAAAPSINLMYFINDSSNDSKFSIQTVNYYWFWNYRYAFEKPWLLQNIGCSKKDIKELCLIIFLNKLNFDNYIKCELDLFDDKMPVLKKNKFLKLFLQIPNKLFLANFDGIQNYVISTGVNKINLVLKISDFNFKIATLTNFVNDGQLGNCDNFCKDILSKIINVMNNKENLENLFFIDLFSESKINDLCVNFDKVLAYKAGLFDSNKTLEKDELNTSSSWFKKAMSAVKRAGNNSPTNPKNFKTELDVTSILSNELKTALFNDLKDLNNAASFLEEYDINVQETYHPINNYSELSPRVYNFMLNNPTSYETMSYKVYCLKTNKMSEFNELVIEAKERRMENYLKSAMHNVWQNLLKTDGGKDFLIGIRFYPDSLEYLHYSKNEYNLDNWELMLTTTMKIPKSQVDIDNFEKILDNRSLKKCRELEKFGLLNFEKCAKGGYKYKNGFYEDFSGI